MSIGERKGDRSGGEGAGKRPKLGLKFGTGQLSERPLPRVEGAR